MTQAIVMALSIAAITLSTVALVIGGAALAFVIGVKNSTHQVVWKPVEPTTLEAESDEDEEEEEIPAVNPNKRVVREELHDLDDPKESSNNWTV